MVLVGPYPTSGLIVSLTALQEGNGGGAVDELSVGREKCPRTTSSSIVDNMIVIIRFSIHRE